MHLKEGNETVTNCNQLNLKAEDGKMRLTDVADTEQLFRIIQSIPSTKQRTQKGRFRCALNKWLFVLRNLSRLFERPKALQEKVFTKLFEQAEIARFSPEERRGYEDSVKAYRDINNAINTAKKDARQEEKVNTALKMRADGMSAELIAKYTSLSIDEIENL